MYENFLPKGGKIFHTICEHKTTTWFLRNCSISCIQFEKHNCFQRDVRLLLTFLDYRTKQLNTLSKDYGHNFFYVLTSSKAGHWFLFFSLISKAFRKPKLGLMLFYLAILELISYAANSYYYKPFNKTLTHSKMHNCCVKAQFLKTLKPRKDLVVIVFKWHL